MNSYYFDTNIFISLADTLSSQSPNIYRLVEFCRIKEISIVTSVETIQEVVHVFKKKHKVKVGKALAKRVMSMVDEVLPIDKEVLNIYLNMIGEYPSFESRDYIHLACCIGNSVSTFVTYDEALKKFRGLEVKAPEEFIS